MRIAQIAPLGESVPPAGYGAIESLVADLTDVLVERGHDVTLYASGDSKTLARLSPSHPRALHSGGEITEPDIYRMLQLAQVRDHAAEFDLIHAHVHSNTGSLAIPMLAGCPCPVVFTIHCTINRDNLRLFRRFSTERYVAISNFQRSRLSQLGQIETVHHGLPFPRFPFTRVPESPPYLAYLGRIRPEKGVHLAVKVALHVGIRLKIAGRIKEVDREYFEREIRPYCNGGMVEFVGELGFDAKTAFLGGALACLTLPQIDEPFGLVAVEAGACGTPMVALSRGALPELVTEGVNGFVADTVQGAVKAVDRVGELDRQTCRSHVAKRFSLDQMVDGYEKVYRSAQCAA